MIYDRQEFFGKYMAFCHDELHKYYPYQSIPSIVDMSFRDFINNNFPKLGNEHVTKIKDKLFSKKIWIISYTYRLKNTYVDGVYDLVTRIRDYRYSEKALPDVIDEEDIVIIDDSWRGVIVIEPDDIRDILRKVDECMNGI